MVPLSNDTGGWGMDKVKALARASCGTRSGLSPWPGQGHSYGQEVAWLLLGTGDLSC